MSEKLKHSLFLLLASIIWGGAFVAQSSGIEYIGPYSYNGIRFLIGAFCLLPLILFRGSVEINGQKEDKKVLLKAGLYSGIILALASNLQQLGMALGTSAGKAGFLTTIYIIFVPILNFLIFGKKLSIKVVLGVIFTIIGLYLLCISKGFSLRRSDLLVILCAVSYAGQILVIDRFAKEVDSIKLSALQFFICGLITCVIMVFKEIIPGGLNEWVKGFNNLGVWISILYSGILSSGVGFTLQIVGQKGLEPTLACLIMSLESVFAAIFGWLILDQILSQREIVGCLLVFLAIIIAQFPERKVIFQNKRASL